MPPQKNNNKSVNDSWKKRKRTGGIRRKCSREYVKIKNSICAIIEKGSLTTDTNRPGSSATNTVEEGSVHDDCASPSGLVIQTNRPGPTLGADNESYMCDNFASQSETGQFDSDSSSTDLEENSEFNKKFDFRNNLREWAVSKNISQEALKDLLNVINQRYPGTVPVDPRTLLQTPRNIVIKEIEGGEYWYNGLTKPLTNILNVWLDLPDMINLNFNVDGLPIFKSSKKEFWPILCNIHERTDVRPLIVGIYYGSGKPKNLNQYLEDFVSEMKTLLENGIHMVKEGEEKIVTVKIRCFICDSPARAFIKGNFVSLKYRSFKRYY